MARAFIRHQQPRLRSGLFFSFIIGLFFSIIDEWHQKYIPGRTCDIFDALADISGILFAAIIYLLNYPFFFKNDDKMHELLLKSKIK